jgi:hypothetical protein
MKTTRYTRKSKGILLFFFLTLRKIEQKLPSGLYVDFFLHSAPFFDQAGICLRGCEYSSSGML